MALILPLPGGPMSALNIAQREMFSRPPEEHFDGFASLRPTQRHLVKPLLGRRSSPAGIEVHAPTFVLAGKRFEELFPLVVRNLSRRHGMTPVDYNASSARRAGAVPGFPDRYR